MQLEELPRSQVKYFNMLLCISKDNPKFRFQMCSAEIHCSEYCGYSAPKNSKKLLAVAELLDERLVCSTSPSAYMQARQVFKLLTDDAANVRQAAATLAAEMLEEEGQLFLGVQVALFGMSLCSCNHPAFADALSTS